MKQQFTNDYSIFYLGNTYAFLKRDYHYPKGVVYQTNFISNTYIEIKGYSTYFLPKHSPNDNTVAIFRVTNKVNDRAYQTEYALKLRNIK